MIPSTPFHYNSAPHFGLRQLREDIETAETRFKTHIKETNAILERLRPTFFDALDVRPDSALRYGTLKNTDKFAEDPVLLAHEDWNRPHWNLNGLTDEHGRYPIRKTTTLRASQDDQDKLTLKTKAWTIREGHKYYKEATQELDRNIDASDLRNVLLEAKRTMSGWTLEELTTKGDPFDNTRFDPFFV